jgi:hypothetical protein
LYEQLITEGQICYKDIIEKLGLVSKDELKLFLEKLLAKDREVIDIFENLVNN